MDVLREIKLLLAGVIIAAPMALLAQDMMSDGLIVISANNARLTLNGGTLPVAQVPLSSDGAHGVVAQSIGGGGFPLIDLTQSTIGLNSGGVLVFASSSGSTSTGALNINNFSPGAGTIQIGPTSGLTASELSEIQLNGLDDSLYLPGPTEISVAPEPGTITLLVLGGLGLAKWRTKRR